MNNQELKELAEWAAEWLGWDIDIGSDYFSPPEGYDFEIFHELYNCQELPGLFFHRGIFSPILAHLAKRKMDNLGWEYAEGSKIRFNNQGRLSTLYWSRILKITRRPNATITDAIPFELEDENNFIALWLAIREAVKGG